MADPFATALAALHSSAGSVAAIFTPSGGSPTDITVIRDQQSREVGFGDSTAILDTNRVQIMRSAVPVRPVNGASLSIGDAAKHADVTAWTEFTIQGDAELDVEGVTWNCNLEPA